MFKKLSYKDVKPLYKIDENGNVFSMYKNGFLNPKKDKDGYLSVVLRGNQNKIYVRIATLVAYNFIGPPPIDMKDPTIDHIDGEVLNNYYKNLRWLERSQNSSIRKNTGLGELNHEAKLNNKQVIEICDLLIDKKLTLQQIGKMYGVHKSTISNIKRKVKWQHLTQRYNFK